MKNESKIRQYLGNNYHLTVSIHFEDDKEYARDWKLFSKHEGWLHDGSDAIMTSETHSEEDLLKFAKEHREIKLNIVFNNILLVTNLIGFIIAIIAILFNNQKFIGFGFGFQWSVIFIMLIKMYFVNKKQKIDDKISVESFKRFLERERENLIREDNKVSK